VAPELAKAMHAGPDRRSNNPLVVAGPKGYERRPTSRRAITDAVGRYDCCDSDAAADNLISCFTQR